MIDSSDPVAAPASVGLPRGGLPRGADAAPAPRAAGRDSVLRRGLAAGDTIAFLAALALALLAPGRPDPGGRFLWGLAAVPLMIVLFKLYGLYDRDVKRISHSTVDDLPWLLHAVLLGGLLVWVYSRVTPMGRLDLAEILSFALGVVCFSTVLRSAVRELASRRVGGEAAVLVGSGPMTAGLVAKLRAHPEYRVRVVGVLADGVRTPEIPDVPLLGGVQDLRRVAADANATRVIISPRDLDDVTLEDLLHRCRMLALKVSVLPQLSDVLGPAVEIDDVEGIMVLGVNPPWLPRSSRALKRAMDLAIAGTSLILLSPLAIAIAVAIKLDSRGPVLFQQERIGKRGKRFRLWKFRTMCVDAEQRRAALLALSTDPGWLKLEHDPRVTRVGHRLRRLSLDELPQLWNVLRGEMSLVGPRPLIEAENDRVEEWARGRLDLTPGLTGYWQVLGRTRIPFAEMVKLDYLYVMNWSLWEDIRLILRTLPAVVRGRGAN
ncbi:MAG: sugar transferase [Solirubrobacteraceae bacterium]